MFQVLAKVLATDQPIKAYDPALKFYSGVPVIALAVLNLVWCLLNSWTFAARDFLRRRGANDEHIRSDL
jgi:hypothetical protein